MTPEDAPAQNPDEPAPVFDDDEAPAVDDDGEVLALSEDMLHRERIDLEAGMSPMPPATILIIVACTLVFGRQIQVGGLDNVQRVIETGAMQREAVLDGEYWRLVSAGFMHASGDHLFGNMAMLFILGMACEHAFGRRSYLFLYTACCVTGSLLTMLTPTPTVGASGAIFGLAGAIIALAWAHRDKIEIRDRRVGLVLGIWSAYTLALGLLSQVVSNSCHLGGLLGGLVLGAILPPAILADRREHERSTLGRLEWTTALTVLISTAVYFLPRLL